MTGRPASLLVPGTAREPWSENALCLGADMETFYPTATGRARKIAERVAKEFCAGCPVRRQCRAHSLRYAEPFGVWGGLTARERRKLISRQEK